MPLSTSASPARPSWRRKGLRALAWLASVYLLVLCALVCFERRIAFPGWSLPNSSTALPKGLVVERVTLRSSDGNTISGWWLPSPGWKAADGAVLYAHGNGKSLPTCVRTLTRWRDELNLSVFGFDYPGFGDSSGEPTEASCYAAGQVCLDWLAAEQRVAPRDLVVVGQSMGAAIAVELAHRQACRLLITSGGFTSLPDAAQHRFFWLPVRHLARLRFESEKKVGTLPTPIFVTHGSEDHVIPLEQGRRLFEAAAQPKHFYPVTGGSHAQPKTPEFFHAVRDFLEETRPAARGSAQVRKDLQNSGA